MRHYEMMVILRDDLDEEGAQALIERIQGSITDGGGEIRTVDDWGKRPFAYEIDHRTAGYYAVFDFEVGPEAMTEIERQLKINDNVVRYKAIRPDARVRKPSAVRVRQPA